MEAVLGTHELGVFCSCRLLLQPLPAQIGDLFQQPGGSCFQPFAHPVTLFQWSPGCCDCCSDCCSLIQPQIYLLQAPVPAGGAALYLHSFQPLIRLSVLPQIAASGFVSLLLLQFILLIADWSAPKNLPLVDRSMSMDRFDVGSACLEENVSCLACS